MTKLDPSIASLINSYRNLAQLWRARADTQMQHGDSFEVYDAIKQSIACENSAHRLEMRYLGRES